MAKHRNRKEKQIKQQNILRIIPRAIHLYLQDKREEKDLQSVPKDMLIFEFMRQRKELHDISIEHKIMKRILIENNLWQILLDDDEFLEFLREDYEG